jgi:hypothetical protein
MAAEAETLARAMAAGNSGDLSGAERITRDVLAKNPQHLERCSFGRLADGAKRPREAVAPLEEAARLSPNPELETYWR